MEKLQINFVKIFRKAANHRLLQAFVLFALFFFAMSWLQFSTPDLPDNDGYYHIRFAAQMREEGLKPDFPYLPLTILNPREFYDHHFLFHAALIPFTFGDLRIGAKFAAVVFSSLSFLSIWYLFNTQGVPYSGLWALGLLGISEAFLYRMSVTRAQSLSLLFLVVGLSLILRKKYGLLALLSFFYVWLYDAFPLMAGLAGLYLLGNWLVEGRLEWRPLVWTISGTALGLLLNIYFPYDVVFIFRHLLPKLTETTAVSVGNEWYPYDTHQLMANSGLALVFFMSGVLALGLHDKRMDLRTTLSLLAAVLFGVMLFQARRFVEYFPAFAIIFTAFAWQPLLIRWRSESEMEMDKLGDEVNELVDRKNHPNYLFVIFKQWLPFLILCSAVLFGLIINLPKARSSIQSAKPYDFFAGASAWLKENTPEGARVFQTDWDDFPRLYYYNTHNTYLIGLDPTYMLQYNAPLYELWVRITQGDVENISKEIPINFNAYYIVSDLQHNGFIKRAEQDPLIEQVYRDNNSVVFRILEE